MKCRIGIRPIIDGRRGGVRETLEAKTTQMAEAAKKLIEENVFYADGTPAEVVISPCTIGGGKEAAICADYFATQNVTATLSVTPCWCYGSETMDIDPLTVKAVWGLNSTERPGAVYLAAVMAAHAQRGLPAFAIYGRDVQDLKDDGLTPDVAEKILRFARCALTVGQMRNKAYVGLGSVCMGIGGSFCDANLMQKYFGIRAEWVDMSEIIRRVNLGIYDEDEYAKELVWIKSACRQGKDWNEEAFGMKNFTPEELEEQWRFVAKMTLIIKDVMLGNDKLAKMGFGEEAMGRNALLGGFQGQRMWTDFMPNGDFAEAILNSTFDWNGKKQPFVLATENDNCNAFSMLFCNLLTNRASVFADVRTFWSKEAAERAGGKKLQGRAADGFIHLINSGAAALDGSGACEGADGAPVMKRWWEIEKRDIDAMLGATEWMPANRGYFRGGGFSSSFSTRGGMPVTLVRLNMVDGIGYVLQLAEGWTVSLPEDVNKILLDRTDRTWPSTWFVPRLNAKDPAFASVYDVMAHWGANHGAFAYGHIGKDLITLASMLRIPVSMHNVEDGDLFRPHSWYSFGTKNPESADFAACRQYGALYK